MLNIYERIGLYLNTFAKPYLHSFILRRKKSQLFNKQIVGMILLINEDVLLAKLYSINNFITCFMFKNYQLFAVYFDFPHTIIIGRDFC